MHKFLDMDPRIYFEDKPYLWDSLNLAHIPVDSLYKGHHDTRQYMCICHHCTVRSGHKVMGSKGLLEWGLVMEAE